MNIRKIISLITAAAAAMSVYASCSAEDNNTTKMTTSVPIIEIEETSVADENTEPTVTVPVETFPDYPVSFPEIEQQTAGNLYEAENAELKNGPEIAYDMDEFSGEGYVTGFKDNGSSSVVFTVDAPSNQHYDISFSIASEKLVNCRISINGTGIADFKTTDDGNFTFITLYGVFLTSGKSSIEIIPEGNICLDYLKLANNTSLEEISYNAKGELVNKNAGDAAKELMSFLSECYGNYIITGQYASDEKNSELDLIYRTTGKYPVIRFSNLEVPYGSYDESFKDIDACADWYRNGGIACVSWYWKAPVGKRSIRTDDTDFSLKKAVTDIDIAMLSQEEIRGLYGEGNISEECYALILDIDSMAGQLTSLKNKGVPVLWRPLPEGCGDWYWWGASGTSSYKWLWKLIYTRLTEYFELDNLIWIWNGQSKSTLVDKSTFDIAAVDLYINNEKDYGSRFYDEFAAVQNFVGSDKLIAISECGSVPDVDTAFRDNAVWSFFGVWYGKYVENDKGEYSEEFTSKDALVRSYNSDGALTLDEYRDICGYEEKETVTEAVTTTASTTSTSASTETNTAQTETSTKD